MAEKHEIRRGATNFDLIVGDEVQEIFADGVSSLAIGYPNSKIVFHSAIPPVSPEQADTAVETRKAILRLVIPTAALIELIANAGQTSAALAKPLEAGANQYLSQLMVFLGSITVVDNAAGAPESSSK